MADLIIDVKALGAQDLRDLNVQLRAYNTAVTKTIALNAQLAQSGNLVIQMQGQITKGQANQLIGLQQTTNAILKQIQANTQHLSSLKQVAATYTQLANAQQQQGQATAKGADNFLAAMIKYRLASAAFHEVVKAVNDAKQAFVDLDYQSARVARVTGPNGRNMARGMIESAAVRYGVTIPEAGEGLYQANTAFKDGKEAAVAYNTALKLVVGTESDMRETIRTLVQVYNQFGDSMDRSLDPAQKINRIGELIAMTWRESKTEMSEFSQALKYMGPIAETARVPLQQVMAVLGGLTFGGIRGRMAGTGGSQEIGQIIKNQGKVTKGDKIYQYDVIRDSQGQMDLIATIQGIMVRYQQLRKTGESIAQEWLVAITGTANATRTLGAITPEVFGKMNSLLKEGNETLAGTKTHLDQIAAMMQDTFVNQFSRAFNGVLTSLADGFKFVDDRIFHIKGMLGDINDWYKRDTAIEERIQSVQQSISAQSGSNRAGTAEINMKSVLASDLATSYGPGHRFQHRAYLKEDIKQQLSAADYATVAPYLTPYAVDGNTDYISEEGLRLAAAKAGRDRILLHTQLRPAEVNVVNYASDEKARKQRVHDLRRDEAIITKELAGPMDVSKRTDREAQLRHIQDEIRSLVPSSNPSISGKPDKGAPRRIAKDLNMEASELEQKAQLILAEAKSRNKRDAEFIGSKTQAEVESLYSQAYEKRKAAGQFVKDPRISGFQKRQYMASTGIEKWNEDVTEKNLKQNVEAGKAMYDNALNKFGFLSPGINTWAEMVDNAQIALAKHRGDKDTIYRIEHGLEGAQADLRSKREGVSGFHRDPATGRININSDISAAISQMASGFGFGDYFTGLDSYTAGKMGEKRTKIDLEMSGKGLFSNWDQRQMLVGRRDAYSSYISTMDKSGGLGKETAKELDEFRRELARINKELEDLDLTKATDYISQVQDNMQNDLDYRLNKFGLTDSPVNARNQFKYDMSRIGQELGILKGALDDPNFFDTDGSVRGRYDRLLQQQRNMPLNRLRRTQDEYTDIVSGGFQDAYHGRGSLKDIPQRIGDKLVDTAIDSFIGNAFNPVTQALAQNTLAIQDNTNVMLGGTPKGGTIGDGTGAGNIPGGGKRGSKAGQYVGYAAAGYSILNNAAQNGTTLGGVIGAGMAGFQMGGWVGAGVGVALNLIGGLFHKSSPREDEQPGYKYAPSQMVEAAYRYNATRGLPDHFITTQKPQQIIIINVDGKTAIAKTVQDWSNEQLSVSMLGENNGYLNLHTVR